MASILPFSLKLKFKAWLGSLGLVLSRSTPFEFGNNPFLDMKALCPSERPFILDVGANVGESIINFLEVYSNPVIHSFEPNSRSFQILNSLFERNNNITTWRTAIGSSNESLLFYENIDSSLSSLLPMINPAVDQITSKYSVSTISLDSFLLSNNINFVDILKIDVQGFEYEVLKGLKKTFERNIIKLVYVDLSFSDYYFNSPSFVDIIKFMIENSFLIVGFYRQHFSNNTLAYADVLFINKSYIG